MHWWSTRSIFAPRLGWSNKESASFSARTPDLCRSAEYLGRMPLDQWVYQLQDQLSPSPSIDIQFSSCRGSNFQICKFHYTNLSANTSRISITTHAHVHGLKRHRIILVRITFLKSSPPATMDCRIYRSSASSFDTVFSFSRVGALSNEDLDPDS